MRKTSLFVLFVVALLIATPVFAREHEAIGDRLYLADNLDKTLPENTPFHVRHGWYLTPESVPGQWFFELQVDGVYLKPTFTTHETAVIDDQVWFLDIWWFNFPDGMTGVHEFTGHFVGPCWYAIELGWTDYCENPNADFEFNAPSITVTFVP